jgi:hypothetical protein
MKESLRAKLIAEIHSLNKRCEQLLTHIEEYKEENNFERAMISDIKYRQLKMVSQSLSKLMN